jgi:hypothetical protein
MILPNSADCAPWFLKVYVVMVIHFLDKLQVLHSQIIIVLSSMRKVFFDLFYTLVDVRKFS